MPLVIGAEQWATVEQLLSGRRVALVSHPAAIDRRHRMTLEKALTTDAFDLVALWGAEHGFWGTHQDMECVDDTTDPWTTRPIRSLYRSAEGLRPQPPDLNNIDAILFDMQDVGARYYTFLHTLAYLIDALHDSDIRLLVLDRPNPLGGTRIEGPILDPDLRSFVGSHPLPVRHGLTPGEFARLYKTENHRDVDLQIIPLHRWHPKTLWSDLNRHWVPPSPNMPSFITALVYPGMCLLEATNVSEGRGTTRPFEWFGAPWFNPFKLCERLNQLHLPGVYFRPHVFRPMFGKHAGKICGGAQIHVTDPNVFEPFWTGIKILEILIDYSGERFRWRDQPYEFVTDQPALDLLCGTTVVRERLERGQRLDDLRGHWRTENHRWLERVQPILLYARPR